MRLNSISTKNYRTLQDLELDFTKHYCTISGRNNAGKSCVIRLLSALFNVGSQYPWDMPENGFDYKDDRTQWVKQPAPIEIAFSLAVTKDEDPALISFIEKIASKKIDAASLSLEIRYSVASSGETTTTVLIDHNAVDGKAAREIDKRIKDSNLLFLYNSTTRRDDYYFGRGRRRMFYEFVMSAKEKKALDDAGKQVERRLRKLAKERTEGLSNILGRLTERYEVEVSPLEGFAAREMPLGINLKDRNVEVPLSDWGSGTQNRTRILMAILQASRIRTTEVLDEKITPLVVIEEPESFLHPSAQAEFGRMLRHLAEELGIQILVTTHSPHMLNQEEPASNILLSRQVKRGKAFATTRIDTTGDGWMVPFADHLGISADEFANLRPLFAADKSQALLVEGSTDVQYFEHLRAGNYPIDKLHQGIEIVAYGGKDTLKNTLLVQFVLRKFNKVFVTYDLDAQNEARTALARAGLSDGTDCCALGLASAGKDCIEGLLPPRILATVNGRETDLVMCLGSKDSGERRAAKELLKKKYLAEFQAHSDYTKDDLKELGKVVRTINARLGG